MFHPSVSWNFAKSCCLRTVIDVLKGLETCPSASRARQKGQSVLNALLVTIVTSRWQPLPAWHMPSKLGATHHAVSPYLVECLPSILRHCLSVLPLRNVCKLAEHREFIFLLFVLCPPHKCGEWGRVGGLWVALSSPQWQIDHSLRKKISLVPSVYKGQAIS